MMLNLNLLRQVASNYYVFENLHSSLKLESQQTQSVFSEKWKNLSDSKTGDSDEAWKSFQLEWFLTLYGFESLLSFSSYLEDLPSNPSIIDAGCGKGYKTAWIATLYKFATVLGIDFSTSVQSAADRYKALTNAVFVQADIATLPLVDCAVDMILCDQVLHHTHSPNLTLKEFSRVLKPGGRLLTYVYRKKALPRELLDDYFRTAVNDLTDDQIWDIARGMTELGKLLTENDIVIDLPEITSLGIRGGRQSLQRYLYWNFFKCFWNEALGFEASLSTNYDWYSPSIAFRYTKHEFLAMLEESGFEVEFFHEEQACYSGRFRKINQK